MANVKLSASEIELACNQEIILTKQKIIETVFNVMGNLGHAYVALAKPLALPYAEVLKPSPKIYKGENYGGMPWVMLDYPRSFSKENIFAIRTFFWWGNYCTISMLLSGKYRTTIQLSNLQKKNNHYFIGITNNPWQQVINNQNFMAVTSITQQQFKALSFMHITKKIPLQEWNNIEDLLLKDYEQYITILTA